jgi:CubicO group peptidase (beta-lactamase class C family)
MLCFSCQTKESKKQEPIKEQTKEVASNSFSAKMDSLYDLGMFNGYSVALVDTTGIIYNQGFGYADVANKIKYTENTIINIASISKVFIGVALLKAQEMNLLDIDEPINKYLPFKVINPNFPNEIITIRQLATHTSSIVDSDTYMETDYINVDDKPIADNLKEKYGLYYQNPSNKWVSLSEYLRNLLDKNESLYDSSTFANKKPGEIYQYSNIGAALCALLIENVAKRPFYEFTKEHIFTPLNMASTTWNIEEVDRTKHSKLYHNEQELPYYKILSYPDGGLITSSKDLSVFLFDLIKAYDGKGSILKANSYEELFKSQLNEAAFEGKRNYNVGIFTEKELAYQVIGHAGGDPGTNTMMYFNTETKRGKIMILNTDSDKEGDMDAYWGIWNALDKY